MPFRFLSGTAFGEDGEVALGPQRLVAMGRYSEAETMVGEHIDQTRLLLATLHGFRAQVQIGRAHV